MDEQEVIMNTKVTETLTVVEDEIGDLFVDSQKGLRNPGEKRVSDPGRNLSLKIETLYMYRKFQQNQVNTTIIVL